MAPKAAGGETSHRAFPLDCLGTLCAADDARCDPTLLLIKDTIAPIGGNGLFLVNAEYRFPILGTLNGGAFADIGQVYAKRISPFQCKIIGRTGTGRVNRTLGSLHAAEPARPAEN